jgi:hypothetical protein
MLLSFFISAQVPDIITRSKGSGYASIPPNNPLYVSSDFRGIAFLRN